MAKTFVEANGVKPVEGSPKRMQREELAGLITGTTHFIGCWITGENARIARANDKTEVKASNAVVRQVAAFD